MTSAQKQMIEQLKEVFNPIILEGLASQEEVDKHITETFVYEGSRPVVAVTLALMRLPVSSTEHGSIIKKVTKKLETIVSLDEQRLIDGLFYQKAPIV